MLKQRVITAMVLLPIALAGFFWLEGAAFALFIGAVVVLGAWEWARLAGLEAQPLRCAYAAVVAHDLARARVDCSKLAGIRDVLAEQIWSQVLSGKVSIESAARSLDTSVRTLQRELHRQGTDFRTLANLVRSQRALELLRHSDVSVARISGSLGYSAPSHFARALRKATGLGPREFRRLVSVKDPA